MSAPGTYVSKLREEQGLTLEGLAHETGIDIQRQCRVERGEVAPSYRERRAYARVFGFASVEDFDQGWRGQRIPLSRGDVYGRIPLINLAPAGPPQDFAEPYVDSGIGRAYIDPPPGVCGPDLFAFVVDGDSMAPDYPEGHYAICRPVAAEQISDGQAVLVRFAASLDFECTFKRCYRVGADSVELRPISPNHTSITVKKVDILRMSPVIAVVSPDHRNSSGSAGTQRIVGEDVQHSPVERDSDRF